MQFYFCYLLNKKKGLVFYMDINRINSILSNDDKVDVFYNNRLVWIQGVANNKAKVGFVDNFEEKDVDIQDLYE